MEAEYFYLKGNASGYFKPKVWNQSSVFSFYNLDFKSIDVKNTTFIDPILFDELKIELYNQPVPSIQTINVFIDEVNYIEESIQDLLFTELLIGKKISINGESFITYNAVVYFKLKRIIPAKIVPSINSTLINKYLPAINPVSTIVSQTAQTITQTNDGTAHRTSYRNTILGALIFSLLLFFFLIFLFGLSFFTILIPILLFYYLVKSAVSNRYPLVNNYIGTRFTFASKFGWFLVLCGIYLLYIDCSVVCIPLIALGLSLVLVSRQNKILRYLGIIGIVFSSIFILGLIKDFVVQEHSKNKIKQESEKRNEDVENKKWEYNPKEIKDTIQTASDDTITISYLSHNLNWDDNYKNHYSGEFRVRKDYFDIVKIQRNLIEPTGAGFTDQFHYIYQQMIKQNKNYLDSVILVYANIGRKNHLDNKMFADMIVTSVQHIPYCLVHDLTHDAADNQYGGFITEYHRSGGPCLPEIKFGIQAPTEFMANLKGDCDTRSVFLYYILSKLGYSVVVLGSEHYSHAILGISGNYNGDCVKYNGLNYYVWETTASGYTPGIIASKVGNMRYWEVVLENIK